MKFNVGDNVRVREWDDMEKEFGLDQFGNIKTPVRFVSTMRKYCGKVFTVKIATDDIYNLEDCKTLGVFWNFYDKTLEPVYEAKNHDWKIVILPDGETTTAKLIKGGKTVKEATVKRYSKDKYSISDAAKFAVEKLAKENPKYYSGKVVCVSKGKNAAYTLGKIYQFKDGRVKIDNECIFPSLGMEPIKNLDDWNNREYTLAKFIELKE